MDTVTTVPDLAAIPAGKLAAIGGTVLADAIRLYLDRLEGRDVPQRSFNSGI